MSIEAMKQEIVQAIRAAILRSKLNNIRTAPKGDQTIGDLAVRVESLELLCEGIEGEHYDQTALELCNECGWKALIPGDGCLVCARQKAKPVWIQRNHLETAQREPSMCRVEPTNRLPDFVPLYTAPPPKYRRGTYVRCMESDELCRVWTTSIDGGAWVKWPDGSITTYTAEQMGQAFSLEQAAPGKPVAYVDERIHGWPDCFVMEPDPPHTVPLYTEPREWVGLTEEEINAIYVQHHNQFGECISGDWGYERDLEAKLKEKNHAG
jgi:hypothetical protein